MSKRRRIPPPQKKLEPLVGPKIESYTVGSWCPNQTGSGPPTAVAISFQVAGFGDLVVCLKSPEVVDNMIQMLLRHKRDVWPDSP